MKTILMMAVLGALCGCAPEKPAEVAALEKRLAELERKFKGQGEILIEVMSLMTNTPPSIVEVLAGLEEAKRAGGERNALISQWMTGEAGRMRAVVELVLEDRAAAFRASARTPLAPVAGTPVAKGGVKDGVPVSVWNQIAARARTEWPGNFQMQAAEIRWQTEAWRKVNR